jgi:FixJ family two-component response regulator
MMSHRKAIAVIEDDVSMQKAVKRLLIAHGYSVEAYSSAEEFLNRPATPKPMCLVLDNRLGGICGIELLQCLAVTGSTLPVIFMTAIHDKRVQDQAIALGCIAYLQKPFLPTALINAIERLGPCV